MPNTDNVFSKLAARARGGDVAASAEMRRHLEPQMIRIVRRVIECGAGASSIDRRILAEARRVGLNAERAASAEGDYLIRAVAHAVSALFVDGLRGPRADRRAADTVCS
jgi:hypothetical protein